MQYPKVRFSYLDKLKDLVFLYGLRKILVFIKLKKHIKSPLTHWIT